MATFRSQAEAQAKMHHYDNGIGFQNAVFGTTWQEVMGNRLAAAELRCKALEEDLAALMLHLRLEHETVLATPAKRVVFSTRG